MLLRPPPRTDNEELNNWLLDLYTYAARSYVSRGNPADWDFTVGDFTTDGTAQALDLSAIIGTGVKLVHLRGAIQDGTVGYGIRLFYPTETNIYAADRMVTQIIDQIAEYGSLWVRCDATGGIKYLAGDTTFTGIWLVVRGWIS